MAEAEDFRAECGSLHDLLADADASFWAETTDFKGWTPYDVICHLHAFDRAAAKSLEGPEAFGAYTDGFRRAREEGVSATDYTRRWLGDPSVPELLALWRGYADELADVYRGVDPRRRVPWGRGPGMSARSCISARQMETWAHGQAVFDLAGRERHEGDRLRNIAVMGVNTYEWSFRNRNLPPPGERPYVKLVAPSAAIWTWNDPCADSQILGGAVEFCQVTAQTRNLADTRLELHGRAAWEWMAIAQCFAGPPQDPPPPGLRRLREQRNG